MLTRVATKFAASKLLLCMSSYAPKEIADFKENLAVCYTNTREICIIKYLTSTVCNMGHASSRNNLNSDNKQSATVIIELFSLSDCKWKLYINAVAKDIAHW